MGAFFLPLMPFFSILYLIIGVGCFFLEPLIRYLAIAVSVLGIIINTIKLFGLFNKNMSAQVVTVLAGTYLAHLIIIYFFTRPRIREQFRH